MTTLSKLLACGCYRTPSLKQAPTASRISKPSALSSIKQFFTAHKAKAPPSLDIESTFNYFLSYFGYIRPYHFNDAVQYILNNSNGLKSSPGRYFKTRGYNTKQEVLEQRPDIVGSQIHEIKVGNRWPRPITQFSVMKAKLQDGKIKARSAFCFPLTVVCAEYMFYAGFNARMGDDWVSSVKCHDTLCGFQSIGVDFSKFDSSVPTWLVHKGLDVIERLIDFGMYETSEKYGDAIPYSSTSLQVLFDYIRWYYTHTPVMISGDVSGRIYTVYEGVRSGGVFTNLLDTIISRIICEHIHTECEEFVAVKTYGDDTHYKCIDCEVDFKVRSLEDFGMHAKIEYPNEHGCLTYCKTECHLGEPYHEGIWYTNIIATTEPVNRHSVVDCLRYTVPTSVQMRQLNRLLQYYPRSNYVPASVRWLETFLKNSEEPATSAL